MYSIYFLQHFPVARREIFNKNKHLQFVNKFLLILRWQCKVCEKISQNRAFRFMLSLFILLSPYINKKFLIWNEVILRVQVPKTSYRIVQNKWKTVWTTHTIGVMYKLWVLRTKVTSYQIINISKSSDSYCPIFKTYGAIS